MTPIAVVAISIDQSVIVFTPSTVEVVSIVPVVDVAFVTTELSAVGSVITRHAHVSILELVAWTELLFVASSCGIVQCVPIGTPVTLRFSR